MVVIRKWIITGIDTKEDQTICVSKRSGMNKFGRRSKVYLVSRNWREHHSPRVKVMTDISTRINRVNRRCKAHFEGMGAWFKVLELVMGGRIVGLL